MTTLARGYRGPLNVTQKAQQRLFVGLGWDPKEGASLLENVSALVKGKALHHDLDLSCYIFDPNKALIDVIGVKNKSASDKTDNIYHSGDNIEGIGDGDDEEISVELKGINPDIAHIVFVVKIISGHCFGEIETPEIRMVDGYSGRVFVQTNLSRKESAEESGYVFAELCFDDGVWMLHYIDAFFNMRTQKDIAELLHSFI